MKKVLVAALAVALAAVMAVPASAFENEFGGYWRTRAYTQQDFSGTKGDITEDGDVTIGDLQQVDTRTRLYYTAKFSDDFKFVNKFELDATWGDESDTSYGNVGTDGVAVEVKNSYVDYNLGNYNFKIGAQYGYLGRGFVMDNDFAGAVITGDFEGVTVPFYWIKAVEGGKGEDKNDADEDILVVSPEYKTGNMSVNPFLVYAFQSKVEPVPATDTDDGKAIPGRKDYNAVNIGVNFDMSLDAMNMWTTLIYQYGSYDKAKISEAGELIVENDKYVDEEVDISAYLMAFGADMNIEGIDLHGQFFYASGDKNSDENFQDLTGGQSYYWSEIMGYGMVDNQVSNNSPADKISNIMAFNLGASMSPMEKVTVGADIWHAMLDEKVDGEDELGTEIDLSASYALKDNLNLDVVAAYLFAGDATGDEDPMQLAAQLSLSF